MSAGNVPGPDDPDYWLWHAVAKDAIRYDVGGTPAPNPGADEAVVRLTTGPRPYLQLGTFDREQLVRSMEPAVARGAAGELSLDDAAHAALDGLRETGAPVPPRAPDDPFPDA